MLTFSLQIYSYKKGNMKIKYFGSIPGLGIGCAFVCKTIMLTVPKFDPSYSCKFLFFYFSSLKSII